jgi:hypothetical protein
MATASSLFDRAKKANDIESILLQGIGGAFFAVFHVIATGILTVGDLFIKPTAALAEAGVAVINTIIVDTVALVIGETAAQTVASFRGPFNLGPFTLPAGMAILLLTYWIVAAYRSEEETSNWVPGLPDVPWGSDEEPEGE